MYSSILSFVHPFCHQSILVSTHPFVRLFIHSSIHPSIHTFVHPVILIFIHPSILFLSSIRFVCSSFFSFIHLFVRSFSSFFHQTCRTGFRFRSFIHPFIHIFFQPIRPSIHISSARGFPYALTRARSLSCARSLLLYHHCRTSPSQLRPIPTSNMPSLVSLTPNPHV